MALQRKKECPFCRASPGSGMPKANTTLNSMIEKLHIRCIHDGCEAVVTLEQLERHENQCPKMEVEALKSEISQLKKVVGEMKASAAKGKSSSKKCWQCGKVGHVRRDCLENSSDGGQHLQAELPHEISLIDKDEICAMAAYRKVRDKKWAVDKWLVDSIASSPMTMDQTIFSKYTRFNRRKKVELLTGGFMDAFGFGSAKLKTGNKEFLVKNILFVPELNVNLFSFDVFKSIDCRVDDDAVCKIENGRSKTITVKCVADEYNRLFIQCTPIKPPNLFNQRQDYLLYNK